MNTLPLRSVVLACLMPLLSPLAACDIDDQIDDVHKCMKKVSKMLDPYAQGESIAEVAMETAKAALFLAPENIGRPPLDSSAVSSADEYQACVKLCIAQFAQLKAACASHDDTRISGIVERLRLLKSFVGAKAVPGIT